MKLGGVDKHCIYTKQWKGVDGQALVHGGRGWERGGLVPSPLENEKKRLLEEILTSFTYVLLMKLGGGDRYTIHAKWKGVGRQAPVHGGRGWRRGVLAPPPP